MQKSLFVYPMLNRGGLGNLLFTWARAEVFAKNHSLKILMPRWCRLDRFGVWIRRERYKRYYGGYFLSRGFIVGLKRLWILLCYRRVSECDFAEGVNINHAVVVFRGMDGCFEPFLYERNYIKKRLNEIVSREMLSASMFGEPFIGVHIRRGDFLCSHLKTADDWFVRAIKEGMKRPEAKGIHVIRVFSDAYPKDVEFVKVSFPDMTVVIMPKAPAIQDILSLSKAAVLICSPHSTFSAWAVFLGQMPSVWGTRFEVLRMYENETDKIIRVCDGDRA